MTDNVYEKICGLIDRAEITYNNNYEPDNNFPKTIDSELATSDDILDHGSGEENQDKFSEHMSSITNNLHLNNLDDSIETIKIAKKEIRNSNQLTEGSREEIWDYLNKAHKMMYPRRKQSNH